MQQLILIFIVTSLATARLSLLLSESALFKPVRLWLLGGGPVAFPQWTYGAFNLAGRALTCAFCTSWHLGALLGLAWVLAGGLTAWQGLWCGLVAGSYLDLLLALRRSPPPSGTLYVTH